MNDPRVGDRVELFRGEDDQWYFRRVAANNETVSTSEGYEHFTDADLEADKLFPNITVFIEQPDGSWEKEKFGG